MSFSKQLGNHLERYERRIRAVYRSSVQELAEIASTPIAQGGRLPVDTGTLRASIRAAINSTPAGSSDSVIGALARWRPGDFTRVGWAGAAASYAWPMEVRYGYARGAAEQWTRIVNDKARQAQARGL